MPSLGVKLERENALIDVLNLCREYGAIYLYRARGEEDQERDAYNSITRRDTGKEICIPCFPVTWNPSGDQLQKAGLREFGEILIQTPMKAWLDEGITYAQIDHTRDGWFIDGAEYHIKDKAQFSQFADTFLYINFTLEKR